MLVRTVIPMLVGLGVFGCAARVQPHLMFQGIALVRANGDVIVLHDLDQLPAIQAAANLPDEDVALLANFADPCKAHLCLVVGTDCLPTGDCKSCNWNSVENSLGSIAYGCCCQDPPGSDD
jgi:hypothetical protein